MTSWPMSILLGGWHQQLQASFSSYHDLTIPRDTNFLAGFLSLGATSCYVTEYAHPSFVNQNFTTPLLQQRRPHFPPHRAKLPLLLACGAHIPPLGVCSPISRTSNSRLHSFPACSTHDRGQASDIVDSGIINSFYPQPTIHVYVIELTALSGLALGPAKHQTCSGRSRISRCQGYNRYSGELPGTF